MGLDYHATVAKEGDGDTVQLHLARSAEEAVVPGWRRTVVDATDPKYPAHVRLIILQAPEMKKPTFEEGKIARDRLLGWLAKYRDRLMVELWPDPNAGAFGRYLGDIYVEGERGNTASQYMLSLGYLPYLGGRS